MSNIKVTKLVLSKDRDAGCCQFHTPEYDANFTRILSPIIYNVKHTTDGHFFYSFNICPDCMTDLDDLINEATST